MASISFSFNYYILLLDDHRRVHIANYPMECLSELTIYPGFCSPPGKQLPCIVTLLLLFLCFLICIFLIADVTFYHWQTAADFLLFSVFQHLFLSIILPNPPRWKIGNETCMMALNTSCIKPTPWFIRFFRFYLVFSREDCIRDSL